MSTSPARTGACTGAEQHKGATLSDQQAEAVGECFGMLACMAHELAALLVQFDGNLEGVQTAAHALATRIGATADTLAVGFGVPAIRGAVGSAFGIAWLDLSPELLHKLGVVR